MFMLETTETIFYTLLAAMILESFAIGYFCHKMFVDIKTSERITKKIKFYRDKINVTSKQ